MPDAPPTLEAAAPAAPEAAVVRFGPVLEEAAEAPEGPLAPALEGA